MVSTEIELDIDWHQIQEEINDIFKPANGEFIIDNMQAAEYVAGKLKIYYDQLSEIQKIQDAKLEKLERLYQEEREKIIHASKMQKSPIEGSIASLWRRYGIQMRSFLDKALDGKKRKSLTFAGITFGTKKAASRVIVKNEDDLLDWLLENKKDHLIKTEYKVPHDHVKALVEELEKEATTEQKDLVLPAGVVKQTGEDKFYVADGRKEINMLLGIGSAETLANPTPAFTTADLLTDDEDIAY